LIINQKIQEHSLSGLRIFRLIELRASCFKALEKYSNAVEDFEECILLDPQSTHAILGMAVCYDHLGDCEQAIQSYSTFLYLDPTSLTALHNRAQNYYQLEKYEEAKSDFSKAIELCDSEEDKEFKHELMACRSKCFVKLNQSEKESKQVEENISLLREKAKNAFLNKKYEEAIELFSKIILKTDSDEDLLLEYFNRGLCYKQIDKVKESIHDFKKVVSIDEDHVKSYIFLSRLTKRIDQIEDSIMFYSKALKLSPNSDLYFERAMIYNELKEYEKSIEDFTKSIEFEAHNPDSYYNRAIIYHRQFKDYVKAESDYNSAIKLSNKKDPDIFVDRALLYYVMEQDEKCKNDFDFALKLDPDNERTKKILSKIKL
jgi:tetratricopeptide (TPR) repeat protein